MPYKTTNFEYLLGIKGLSDQLLNNHFALYQGYVSSLNKMEEFLFARLKDGNTASPEYMEVKRRISWEFNGMALHEYYFENIKKNESALDPESKLSDKIIEDHGSYDMWKKSFKAAASMRGVGWVISCYEPRGNRIYNTWINEHDTGHLCGATPLLVLDVFEHAFMLDYGIKRADYIEAFFKMIDWDIVAKRFDSAISKK